jgi:hypothetical protein
MELGSRPCPGNNSEKDHPSHHVQGYTVHASKEEPQYLIKSDTTNHRVFTPYPPANACPPGRVWHDAQCPAAARDSPWVMHSAGKLSGAGRSMGAIARRQDKSKTPANPSNATARIAMPIRRIIASLLPSGLLAILYNKSRSARLSTTSPRNDLALNGAELSYTTAPPRSGMGPSSSVPDAVAAATLIRPAAKIHKVRFRIRRRRLQPAQMPVELLAADCDQRRP